MYMSNNSDPLTTLNSLYAKMSDSKKESDIAAKKSDNERKREDRRYSTLIIALTNELDRRKIDIMAPDFDNKLDEIIEELLSKPAIKKRFGDAETITLRNAVKRSINKEKNESKER